MSLPPIARKLFPGGDQAWHMLLSVARNSGWLLVDRLLRALLALSLIVWLARSLGPIQFGLYSYALAFVGMFAPIAALGIDTILVRELVTRSAESRKLVIAAAMLKSIGGSAAFLLSLVAILVVRPGDNQVAVLVAVAASAFLFQAGDAADAWNQSRKDNRRSAIVRSFVCLAGAVVKATCILSRAPLEAFIAVSSLEVLAVSILLLRGFGPNAIELEGARARARSLLAISWPFIFSGIAISIYMRIDQLMIGSMLTDADVGNYGAATRLSEVWYLVPSIVVTAASPHLLETFSKSRELFDSHLQRLLQVFLFVSILLACLVSAFSGLIVRMVFGAEFVAAASILTVHVWSAIFVFVGLASTVWMLAHGYFKYSLFQTVVGAVLNMALNLVLIPRIGAVGAAWATLISYAVVNYLINLLFGFSRPLFFLASRALFRKPFRV